MLNFVNFIIDVESFDFKLYLTTLISSTTQMLSNGTVILWGNNCEDRC
jgi:hypothetical protein